MCKSKDAPPGLPKIPSNLRQTTTGLSINRQELRSCSLIGPPSAPGCPPSSSSSSSWCSYTSVTGVTKGQTRRQDGQSSTSSLCLRPGTVPIAARNQSRLPWNTPPRFTRRHQRRSNPMYTQQPYSFPGSFLPGGPIVATPVLFSSDGVQFSRVGFPGVNHTQFPPITYVRDECWSPRIREVRRSPSPPRQRCVSYSSRDSSARVEP